MTKKKKKKKRKEKKNVQFCFVLVWFLMRENFYKSIREKKRNNNKDLDEEISNATMEHIYRETNQCADILAKIRSLQSMNYCIFYN